MVDENMGDTIKVTVIATGFDRADARKGSNVQDLPIAKEAHDIPTIIRNRWEQERLAKVRVPEGAETVEDEYDIPAFLRRKADA